MNHFCAVLCALGVRVSHTKPIEWKESISCTISKFKGVTATAVNFSLQISHSQKPFVIGNWFVWVRASEIEESKEIRSVPHTNTTCSKPMAEQNDTARILDSFLLHFQLFFVVFFIRAVFTLFVHFCRTNRMGWVAIPLIGSIGVALLKPIFYRNWTVSKQ